MPEVLSLHEGGAFFQDGRRVVREGDEAIPSIDDAIVPLAQWKAERTAGKAPAALWLAAGDDVVEIAGALEAVRLIALDFPKAADGRAYSSAALLRTRFGYRGDLRAIGDVHIDQLYFLRRVGFDSAQLPERWSSAASLPTIRAALRTFSDSYQAAADQPLPLFKRRLLGEVRA